MLRAHYLYYECRPDRVDSEEVGHGLQVVVVSPLILGEQTSIVDEEVEPATFKMTFNVLGERFQALFVQVAQQI